jgi:hypothetical protein
MLAIFLECLCNISEKCTMEYFWKVFEKQLNISGKCTLVFIRYRHGGNFFFSFFLFLFSPVIVYMIE